MTTEDIPALIAYARNTQAAVNVATVLRHGIDDGSHLIDRLADTLETVTAERDALRVQIEGHGGWDEWISEHVKVSGVNDALRAQIDNVRLYCENQGDKFHYHAEQILGFLSRAIDTKGGE